MSCSNSQCPGCHWQWSEETSVTRTQYSGWRGQGDLKPAVIVKYNSTHSGCSGRGHLAGGCLSRDSGVVQSRWDSGGLAVMHSAALVSGSRHGTHSHLLGAEADGAL